MPDDTRARIGVIVYRGPLTETGRRAFPWHRWHWKCDTCGQSDRWGHWTQRRVKLAMISHIDERHRDA